MPSFYKVYLFIVFVQFSTSLFFINDYLLQRGFKKNNYFFQNNLKQGNVIKLCSLILISRAHLYLTMSWDSFQRILISLILKQFLNYVRQNSGFRPVSELKPFFKSGF